LRWLGSRTDVGLGSHTCCWARKPHLPALARKPHLCWLGSRTCVGSEAAPAVGSEAAPALDKNEIEVSSRPNSVKRMDFHPLHVFYRLSCLVLYTPLAGRMLRAGGRDAPPPPPQYMPLRALASPRVRARITRVRFSTCSIAAVRNDTCSFCGAVAPSARPMQFKRTLGPLARMTGHLSRPPALIRPPKARSMSLFAGLVTAPSRGPPCCKKGLGRARGRMR
jgi:hypothetical protein